MRSQKLTDGDLQAIREIADRLDGKVTAFVEADVSVEPNPLTELIAEIARRNNRLVPLASDDERVIDAVASMPKRVSKSIG